MNILASIAMATGLATMPMLSNPFAGLSLSAGGVEIQIDGDGVTATPCNTADFEIEVKMTSGKPIRVRL